MSITTEALLLAKYNAYAPSATEITAWKTVNKNLAADEFAIKAGLFGADLTDFNEECAELDWCDVTDYETFSGWAVGIVWTPATGADQATPLGVAFNGLKTYVEATFTASAASVVKHVALTADASATLPSGSTLVASTDAFAAWSFKSVTGFLEQTAFYFQDSDDDFYLEAEDTDDLWSTKGTVATVAGNIETADFVFVGAASLVAASASIIVASLLF
jgi:hypothetical protein